MRRKRVRARDRGGGGTEKEMGSEGSGKKDQLTHLKVKPRWRGSCEFDISEPMSVRKASTESAM
jgi:hypothetical protein